MFNLMRTHNRVLMLVVTVLTIIAFVVLYNQGTLEGLGRDRVAKIYGRDLSNADIQRGFRAFELSLALGMSEFASTLDGAGDAGNGVDFLFNVIVLREEAKRLGVEPTTQEIKDAIAGLRVFQTNGQFDPAKYMGFIQNVLAPRGFTEIEIEELVRDSLALTRIQSIVDSAPAMSDAELRFTNRAFQPVSGTALIFELEKYGAGATVPEDQIEAFFELSQADLFTPAVRTVRYVTFELPESDAALEGKERVEALQKVADRSAEFADLAAEQSFLSATREMDVPYKTSEPFDIQGNVPVGDLLMGGEPSKTDPSVALAPVAFTLSAGSPVSSAFQDGDRFYVIELVDEIPDRPLTLDEARPLIEEELLGINAQAKLEGAAESALSAIRSATASGTSIDQAAAQIGVTTRPFTNVASLSENAPEQDREFAEAAQFLREKELSGLGAISDGLFAVWLESRSPLDEAEFATSKNEIRDYLLSREQTILLYEWLIAAREESGLVVFGDEDDIDE